MKSFESTLTYTARHVRSRLAKLESLPCFDLTINVHGRVHDGDINIEFRLGEYHYTDVVKGGNLEAVITEFLRRRGWTERNAPLCLPAVEQEEVIDAQDQVDDRIPF